ncbi:hypothetical protein LY90DRAFT_404638, partial [Neocallimastix californiae]
CKKGYCCSKYGWCGKSEVYCDVNQGCQSEFGECNKNNGNGKQSDAEIAGIPTEDDNESPKTAKVSENDRCGKGFGVCKKGYCCSKHGWCGKSEKYCDVNQGCQSEFGQCNSTGKTEGSTERCGKGYGKCAKGYCCSKYGWCGKSQKYCDVNQGCQSEFGKCNEVINTNGRCGSKYGKCSEGECCSKYGWCGISSKYCNISEGCQSEFGNCKTKKTITETTTMRTIRKSLNGRCGEKYGKCLHGECCSKYGYCGTSKKYCEKSSGCQSNYGACW